MPQCFRCGSASYGQYCPDCGTKFSSPVQVQRTYEAAAPHNARLHPAAARGFGQLFGLDPRIAMLTLVVDFMLFGGEFVTAGLIWPFSVAAGIVLGVIAYKGQMRWYGDDRESATIKGLILGLLTAIPTPLPALLYIPSGVLGLVHNIVNRTRFLQRRVTPGHP